MNFKSINPGDLIFATISYLGRVVANLRLSGITSLDDILRHYRAEGGKMVPGMVTVSIRNYTAGWTGSRSIVMRR